MTKLPKALRPQRETAPAQVTHARDLREQSVSGSAGFSPASSQFLIAKTAVLMHPDNMLETFSEVAVKGPELMWPVLQASVAALVNVQSTEAVGAEIKRWAVVLN